jgi:hypothetical protein
MLEKILPIVKPRREMNMATLEDKKRGMPHIDFNKEYFDHIKKINDVYYDQIRIADQKAAYLFTFMLAFIVTSVEGRGAFSFHRYTSGAVIEIAFSAVLAVAVATCVVSAILVVLPRNRAAGTSLYWAAWQQSKERLIEAARLGDPDYLMREYLGNVDNLVLIVRSKYRFVAIAFRSLLIAILAYVVLLSLR